MMMMSVIVIPSSVSNRRLFRKLYYQTYHVWRRVFIVQQCLQRLKLDGNRSEQLYPVQPLPSCAIVSAKIP